MREILFRGKRIDNGEWVYGYYKVGINGRTTIFDLSSESLHIVIPETVGQYTGINDKYGYKVFEHDKLRGRLFMCTDGVVNYESGIFKVSGVSLCSFFRHEIEVIGNVHDGE